MKVNDFLFGSVFLYNNDYQVCPNRYDRSTVPCFLGIDIETSTGDRKIHRDTRFLELKSPPLLACTMNVILSPRLDFVFLKSRDLGSQIITDVVDNLLY